MSDTVDEPASRAEGRSSLWRNREFLRLWFARAVSSAGSQVSAVALPLTAVLVLGATPGQMGLLNVAGRVPYLLFDLFVGVWVDRRRRGPVLVGADLGRALLLATIPAAALAGYLTLAQLYVIAFLLGTMGVFFSLASISILPALVTREQLVEANSKLSLTDSVIAIAGPSGAGALVQAASAPRAILADAVTYVLSALSLRGIGVAEMVRRGTRGSVRAEIGEGIRELVRTPVLRALAVSVSVGTFGVAMQQTVLVLFVVRELRFSPVLVGLMAACGGVGSLLGALLAGRSVRMMGIGRAIVLGNSLWAAGALLVPFAGLAGAALPFVFVGAGQAVADLGATIWGVNQMSLRQAITPVGLFARATAARRLFMTGAQVLGAALGGFLGGAIGLRATLLVGALGVVAGFALLYFSPVRDIRDLT